MANPNPSQDKNPNQDPPAPPKPDDGAGNNPPAPPAPPAPPTPPTPPAPPAPPQPKPAEVASNEGDCKETTKGLRKLVNEQYGKDFTVRSVGRGKAYIENTRTGLKIDTNTGDPVS